MGNMLERRSPWQRKKDGTDQKNNWFKIGKKKNNSCKSITKQCEYCGDGKEADRTIGVWSGYRYPQYCWHSRISHLHKWICCGGTGVGGTRDKSDAGWTDP